MSVGTSKVIHLHRHMPQQALERLNRITGLCFANWPESLAPLPGEAASDVRIAEKTQHFVSETALSR